MNFCLVLDIGKTNIKLHVVSKSFESVYSVSAQNNVCNESPYPHVNVDIIWDWVLRNCKEIAVAFQITAISICTHGATAALINRNSKSQSGLALPIMDYEYAGINTVNSYYELIRPEFGDTLSPNLPAGLNLGKQLYWQRQNYVAYSASTDVLMYPQYWAWRFSGVVSSEVTSLGCHTDLWLPLKNDFSKLVKQLDLAGKIPEMVRAWQPLGKITSDFANLTGFSRDCLVYPGVHDSNASLIRYNILQKDKSFTVISTGTWTVMLNNGGSVNQLDNKKDMLTNTNIFSQAVPCARFMGGREFEAICKKLGGAFGDAVNSNQLQILLDKKVMAMPDFSDGSGPFGGLEPEFIGIERMLNKSNFGAELATLYCALMIDYQLEQLGSDGDIYIEGAFLKNPVLCGLVAQLRQQQTVYLSNDTTGTVTACACLVAWPVSNIKLDIHRCQSSSFTNLHEYKALWLSTILEKREYEKHS